MIAPTVRGCKGTFGGNGAEIPPVIVRFPTLINVTGSLAES
jgi:hypothetical protein